jgi:hypothetical protein
MVGREVWLEKEAMVETVVWGARRPSKINAQRPLEPVEMGPRAARVEMVELVEVELAVLRLQYTS